ncbi:Protein transport protein yif1 [Novymonas esmeraldas]|uniref:Protein YIF1 n=1 Tax=Novymonas esmeraldas TaxID=1808958 RepID=A0AAW0EP97_9TRYP
MQTPQTPTINFGAGGGAQFGRSDPNAMMLQMGLSYGQNILQHRIQQGEAGLAYYMPVIHAIRNYFAVDNTYVKRKLVMLTVPFFTKYVRKAPAGGESDFGVGGGGGGAAGGVGAGGGAGDMGGDQVFGGPPGTPASMYPTGSPATRPSNDSGNSVSTSPSLPLHDVFASDLYIPLMSVITYVVLAAFIDGANSPTSIITAASLISTAWVIGIWFLVEVAVLKGVAYALRVIPNPPLLELLALCGYKFVLLCLCVFVSQGLPPGRLYTGLVLLYGIAAHSFFTVRVTGLHYMRDDGRVPPRSRVFTYVEAVAQVPAFLWLFLRLLYSG